MYTQGTECSPLAYQPPRVDNWEVKRTASGMQSGGKQGARKPFDSLEELSTQWNRGWWAGSTE